MILFNGSSINAHIYKGHYQKMEKFQITNKNVSDFLFSKYKILV